MLAHLRKQASRKEMGIFQYLTWADCQANGDVMPAMVLLIHKPDFRQEKANNILPLDICTIEDVEDWAFAHNRKTDASWCVVPATWNGTQWTVAGVFTEQEWMTKVRLDARSQQQRSPLDAQKLPALQRACLLLREPAQTRRAPRNLLRPRQPTA